MAKVLELEFKTETGKSAKLSINDPVDPIDTVAVKAAMDNLIATNVFASATGAFVSVEGARVVERNVTDYDVM
ncbi:MULTISPECIES: DUF2922 domain-containing protein [Rossellomorea]|uniref:DUF2922 domain-containing protein n=1 Tax=Rossellomorea TaxID=2837508 RepID=UPI001CCACB98|nr:MULTISPECIES: DUF2922 domain-containing protein [Rossellomorea]MCA0150499.1 DUF2922 domain-containing protein [Rossellomorea vietnamensis]UTE77394.1 DUF2922 domain-containing protein [Rossellomorea sp. KS-H15a]WGG45274.1 DUF2922 domain-containing protein [Rossellomorea sp. DA94]